MILQHLRCHAHEHCEESHVRSTFPQLPKLIRQWSHLNEPLVNIVKVTKTAVHPSPWYGRLSPHGCNVFTVQAQMLIVEFFLGRAQELSCAVIAITCLVPTLCGFRDQIRWPSRNQGFTKSQKHGRLGSSCHASRSPPATGIGTEESTRSQRAYSWTPSIRRYRRPFESTRQKKWFHMCNFKRVAGREEPAATKGRFKHKNL